MDPTVLVADAQPLYRAAVCRVVEDVPSLRLAGEAGGEDELLAALERDAPAVLVLADDLPSANDRDLLGHLAGPGAPRIVLLLADADARSVWSALARGAAACVTRSVEPRRLREALLAVAAGGVYLQPDVQRAVAAAARSRGEPDPLLTARELEVLRRVAAGESAPAISAALHLAPSTIKAHLAHLYAKLDVSERGAAVAAGFRRGLLD